MRKNHRDRLAALLSVDRTFPRLVRTLKRTGQFENTLIFFTSDNGFMFGEHRLKGKSKLYEDSARVPLYMAGPGVPRGAIREQIVANIDFAPTIHDATQTSPMQPPDGLSLLPVLSDPEAYGDRSILLENREAAAVRDPEYVYVEHDYDDDNNADEYELYDMDHDPHQLENLLDVRSSDVRSDLGLSHADRAQLAQRRDELSERLAALRTCAGQPSCR